MRITNIANTSYQMQNIKEKTAKPSNLTTPAPKTDSIEISSKGKALSKDAIDKINQQSQESFNTMLNSMLGKQVDSAKISNDFQAVLAKIGMENLTPEQAASNVSEEGPYGVNAVATNIVDMAISLSGGNAEKMEMLKDSVLKGFEAAGIELGLEEGLSNLPQVSQDTYTEVMKRFDHYAQNGNLDSYEYTPYE